MSATKNPHDEKTAASIADRWVNKSASETVTDRWMERHAAESWDELVRQDEECVCEHGASEHTRKDPHSCTVCTSERCPKFRSSQSE
jgi:hypothetical protein